jgi:hypothetical protein
MADPSDHVAIRAVWMEPPPSMTRTRPMTSSPRTDVTKVLASKQRTTVTVPRPLQTASL